MPLLSKSQFIRPRVTIRAKKKDFIEPGEAPGEGRRRPPNEKENRDSGLAAKDDIGGRERIQVESTKKAEAANPIKKFIMKFFKIKEIDYEKFRKEDKWAIKIKDEPPRE
jgi:hypothetical protein